MSLLLRTLLQQQYGMLHCRKVFLVNVYPNPSPTNDAMCSIKYLYLNARSLTNKTDEL
jgi:hypothetical protein